jgi:catechol 2,3-dioxygenase-like lactoylglutathione lyase family enzyme
MNYGEVEEPSSSQSQRCYIRDPDGYIIEIAQSKPDFAYGKAA